jgi:DNA-binding transcriptional ArsR family regulator
VSARRDTRREDGPERLASVVGRTRARILAAVREPRTTDEVAGAVGAASSTASEHLNALFDTGLVTRRRVARHVYYELSERGRALLDVLDAP